MAKRLGMSKTHFVNSTGLPDPLHMTTARDLITLSKALVNDFPDFYKIYSMKEFTYSNIRQPNRNRLLFIDPSVDGLKTGHTNSAGYCLVTSAKRENRRLISVVLGANSDISRAMESQKLLNFGFQFYETVKLYSANQAVSRLRIYKGSSREIKAGFLRDFHVTVPRGASKQIKAELITQQPLLAPIAQGQRLGTVRLSIDGELLGDYPLLALEKVGVAGILSRGWDNILLLFK
jgi:D-alanyl-D-alanine carboxypeptidase (penicillin-binding protein 5/6)